MYSFRHAGNSNNNSNRHHQYIHRQQHNRFHIAVGVPIDRLRSRFYEQWHDSRQRHEEWDNEFTGEEDRPPCGPESPYGE